jgi:hypothetical protein
MEASLFLKIKTFFFLKFAPFFITMIGDAEAAKAMYADGKKDHEKAYSEKYAAIVRFMFQKANDGSIFYHGLLSIISEIFPWGFKSMSEIVFPGMRKEASEVFAIGECEDRAEIGKDMVNKIEDGFINALYSTLENNFSFGAASSNGFLLGISKVNSYLKLANTVALTLRAMPMDMSTILDDKNTLLKTVDTSIAEIESGNRSLDDGSLLGGKVVVFFSPYFAPFLPNVMKKSYRNKFFFFRLLVISLVQKRHK